MRLFEPHRRGRVPDLLTNRSLTAPLGSLSPLAQGYLITLTRLLGEGPGQSIDSDPLPSGLARQLAI